MPSYEEIRGQGYGPILQYLVQLIGQCMTYLLQAEVRHHDMHVQLQVLNDKVNALEDAHPTPTHSSPPQQSNLDPAPGQLHPQRISSEMTGIVPQLNIVTEDDELFLSSDSSFEAADQTVLSQPNDQTPSKPSSPGYDTTPFKLLSSGMSVGNSVVAPSSLGTSPSDWLLASIHASPMSTMASPFRTGATTSPLALGDIHLNLPPNEPTTITNTTIKGAKLQANLFPSPPKAPSGDPISLFSELKTTSAIPRSSPVSVLQGIESPITAPAMEDKAPLRVSPSPSKAPVHPFKQQSFDARMGSF